MVLWGRVHDEVAVNFIVGRSLPAKALALLLQTTKQTREAASTEIIQRANTLHLQRRDGENTATLCAAVELLECAKRHPVRLACGGSYTLCQIGISGECYRQYCFHWGDDGTHGDYHECPLRCHEIEALPDHILTVAVGFSHLAAVTVKGALFTWGKGPDRQLGHGASENELAPRQVETLRHVVITAVSLANSHSAAVSAEGELFTWGYSDFQALGYHCDEAFQSTPKRVTGQLDTRAVAQISCGFSHTGAVTAGGELFTWGHSPQGALGHGPGVTEATEPQRVEHFRDCGVNAVSCSCFFSVALVSDGGVFTWGFGSKGQLGHGGYQNEDSPRLVEALSAHRVVSIATGESLTTALTSIGGVWEWGLISDGLGAVSPTKVSLNHLENQPRIVAIAAGDRYTTGVLQEAHGSPGVDEISIATWGSSGLGYSPPEGRPEEPRRLMLLGKEAGSLMWSNTDDVEGVTQDSLLSTLKELKAMKAALGIRLADTEAEVRGCTEALSALPQASGAGRTAGLAGGEPG